MRKLRINTYRFTKGGRRKYYAKKGPVIIISPIFTIFLLTAIMLPAVFFLVPMSEKVVASTLYVGGSGGGNYSTIQEAVDAALAGDTVYVYNKTYYESIHINKSINLIGENILGSRPIIDGLMNPQVVHIDNVNHFNMSGFEVINGSFEPLFYSGIFIDSSSNVTLINNTIHSNEIGIQLFSSSFITIRGNEIHNNVVNGIHSLRSSNNNFINNIVYGNQGTGGSGGNGFYFSRCPYYNNKIEGNIVYNNREGIHLEDDSTSDGLRFLNNSLINNTVFDNMGNGIFITYQGEYNFVIDNVVYHNGLGSINPRGGIYIESSNYNLIKGNVVYDNDHGIIVLQGVIDKSPRHNTFTDNKVYNNENGIRLGRAVENTFVNNMIFNNIKSIYIERQSTNNIFINCTLTNPGNDDFNLTGNSHALTLNTTFNKTRVYYGDTLSTLTVNWFMHVKVIYWNGSPVCNAMIWVNDTYGTNLIKGPADYEGWTKWIVVTEYIEQDINGDHIGDRTYFTPHHDIATDRKLWGYADPFMDISKVVIIILGSPPPLLPPTNLTTKVVNNGDNVELEWDPVASLVLDHYLIYRADSATKFDFTIPYNISTTWPDPKNTTWIDPDPGVTAVDDDFYYIIRAANADESDISSTSNTAGVWTRTFQAGISTFSLPLEQFIVLDVDFYCYHMNASYIKWMNLTTHTWMRHDLGDGIINNTQMKLGEGFEVSFTNQTRYTFTGMPAAMISYDDDSLLLGFDPANEAKNLSVSVQSNGDVNLTWEEPVSKGVGDRYEIYYSNTRDGFFGTFDVDYFLVSTVNFGNNTTTHVGANASNAGARLYYMVVPFNASGVRGSSTYSIGVWTEDYLAEYDTFGVPLKMIYNYTADWYCDNIPDTVGINYYIVNEQRWGWHSERMPEGAYDPVIVMTEGYQISTSIATKFIFIGI